MLTRGLRRSGGIQGGLANGETIVAKVAFKPTSTISRKQKTVCGCAAHECCQQREVMKCMQGRRLC